MGLVSWLRGRRNKQPRPPWVRPEFLGLFALLVTAAAGLGFWSTQDDTPSSGAVSGRTEREYVGIQPAEIGLALPCEPACYADWLMDAWIRDHPDAEILGKTPRYHEGILIGYDVEYRRT